jgi:hypothetical protein
MSAAVLTSWLVTALPIAATVVGAAIDEIAA